MNTPHPLLNTRASLAKAITLIESTREDHQREAQSLLTSLLPDTGRSIRIGITGVPGVGKSTFIEAIGMHVIEQGHKVAVLAIDPSSTRTGGSILGDKTRMGRLAQHESAYIRPSPTSGSLGGVARRTREGMLLCEAAGYDVIIVETVGVGQSEIEVADMVDMFILLLLPGSGDELQGIKKGIVELADLLVVNKADGDLLPQAKRVRTDYAAALRMLHPASEHWQPTAVTCSALEGKGIDAVWEQVENYRSAMHNSGLLDAKRGLQAKAWMWKEIRETLLTRFSHDSAVQETLGQMEAKVQSGQLSATSAAMQLIASFFKNN
jgi:LAO/AO transport system kinase